MILLKRTLSYVKENWIKNFASYLNTDRRISAKRMREFKDKHKGERCFIIGNGPSLNKMDLVPLEHEYTFGLNRIFLLFPKLGFTTTYLVAVNRLVIEQSVDDLHALSIPKFINLKSQSIMPMSDNLIFVYSLRNTPLGGTQFSKYPSFGVWEGSTVTYVAMQLAYYMGFQQAILIGVDHNFVTKGTPHKVVVSQEADQNHFAGNYFGPGFRWQLPDLETSEIAYRVAKKVYANDGREIVDATINGKLDIYRKVDYYSLF